MELSETDVGSRWCKRDDGGGGVYSAWITGCPSAPVLLVPLQAGLVRRKMGLMVSLHRLVLFSAPPVFGPNVCA